MRKVRAVIAAGKRVYWSFAGRRFLMQVEVGSLHRVLTRTH
jgi:hypothetical protein